MCENEWLSQRSCLKQGRQGCKLCMELPTNKWLLKWFVRSVLTIQPGLRSWMVTLMSSKKLEVLENCKNVTDCQYSLLVDECDLLKRKMLIAESFTAKWFYDSRIASMIVNTSIDDLKRCAAHAQKLSDISSVLSRLA